MSDAVARLRPSPLTFPANATLPLDQVLWGPDIPDDSTLRLLPSVAGKRVLQLGAAHGHTAVGLALAGAHVIVVDPDNSKLGEARSLAEQHEVRIELHHGEFAELPFVRADSIDAALSVFDLGRTDDLDRVLRQVSRVLRTGAALVASFPHPSFAFLDPESQGAPRLMRAYDDATPRDVEGVTVWPRTIGDIYASFHRANLRVDSLLEPKAVVEGRPSPFWTDTLRAAPATLIVRGRNDGA